MKTIQREVLEFIYDELDLAINRDEVRELTQYLSDLTEDEYEDLKEFAGQTALKPGLIDEYRNYKYNAEEQGQTPMSPRDYFRMEFGAARMGVAKGGPIELNINVGGNKMEDIKGQTAGPDWYQERIENLELKLDFFSE